MSKTTHIIAVLDRSGSMGSLVDEVITNFNYFIKEQQSVEGKAKLTLVLFDDRYEVLYDEVDLQEVQPLTKDQYFARGMTAMYDAVGKVLTDKQKKKKGIVFIHTDGLENASREWSASKVKEKIKDLETKWDFIFAGANIDAFDEGAQFGMLNSNTINVTNDSHGITRTYANVLAKTTAYRTVGLSASASLDLESIQNYADSDKVINEILNKTKAQ
jgi:hypothetical protein